MQYTYTTGGNIGTLFYREKDDTATRTYSYDSLRRSSKTVYMPKTSAIDAKKLYTTLQYQPSQFTVDGKTRKTTTDLVSTYTNKFGSSGTPVSEYTYTYDTAWKDKLIKYDGRTITYDKMGRPTDYMGKTMPWDSSGNLTAIGNTGNGTVRYTYASDGQRRTKTINGKTTTYHYNNGILLSEQTGDETLRYYYDAAGKVTTLTYKKGTKAEVSYFYARNLQGDITAIYRNSDSKLIGTYEYDLWGRLVSPDDISLLSKDFKNVIQYNLYVYCWNNPVNLADETGNLPAWVNKTIAVVAVAAVVVAATAITVGTCGAGSVAGIAMISATATLAARTTEVAVLQVKKEKLEGKNNTEIAKDTMESIYDNGDKIIRYNPATKTVGIGIKHYLYANVESIFGGHQALSTTLKMPSGKIVPYVFVAMAWVHTAFSALVKIHLQEMKKGVMY